MAKKNFRFLFAILILAIITNGAQAATYYVATIGNDANNGSQAAPWKTIQKAANTVAAGDTVFVLAGNYSTERVIMSRSGAQGKPITFQGEMGNNGTLGDYRVIMKGFDLAASFIVVKGFEIANTSYEPGNSRMGAGIFVEGRNNLIEGNYVHDAALTGIELYGLTHTNPSYNAAKEAVNCTVRNNKLYHNQQAGMRVSGQDNYVEGNEVWQTVQCHPAVIAYYAGRSNLTCPKFDQSLDADGIRFFGSRNVLRKNYVHDIPYGPPGINPAIGDYIDNSHTDCFQTWGESYWPISQNVLVEQNVCDNAQFHGGGEAGTGIMINHAINLTIRNNIIRAFTGVMPWYAVHTTIIGNTFFNNLSFSVNNSPAGVRFISCNDTTIKNNIFVDMPFQVISPREDFHGLYAGKNIAYRSDSKTPPTDRYYDHANDLWGVDPIFVSVTDFHLQQGSPAIDAGYTLLDALPYDFDGVSRPQGAGYDIGAYEFLSAGTRVCTENDWAHSDGVCQSSNTLTRSWTKTGPCQDGVAHPSSETVGCVYSPLAGDVNGDQTVNARDVQMVVSDLGKNAGYAPGCDQNGDNTVNLRDLAVVALHYGISRSG